MMKIKMGQYVKKDNSIREIDVLVLEEDKENFKGIDLTKLNNDEKKELMDALESFEKVIDKVFNKSFRHFKTIHFTADEKEEK